MQDVYTFVKLWLNITKDLMKQKLKHLILTLSIVAGGLSFFVPATPVAAQPCKTDGGVTIGETNAGDCATNTAFRFGSCGNTNVGISCLVGTLMRFLSVVVGIAVVGGITVGGIMYSTSKGNPANVQKAITIITNSVIGLVLFFLMFAIVNFLVPGGVLVR